MYNWDKIPANAQAFQARWRNTPGNEQQEAHQFMVEFMSVFGVEWQPGHTEHYVFVDGVQKRIDYLLPGKILIEMKSKGRSLLSAHSQAMSYVNALPPEDAPILVMVSDFDKFEVYNLRKNHKYTPFRLRDLAKKWRIFGLLAGLGEDVHEPTEVEVNVDASYKMANLHDRLKANNYSGHDLEVYLVRLLFCLFAEDTGIFEQDAFKNYIIASHPDGRDLASRLAELFEVLNTPPERRMTNLRPELARFRYINGSLFKARLPIAAFDKDMRGTLLDCATGFDWAEISPSIFGAMFQGVMDQTARRTLGAHYTSVDNILKVIRPLFLDELLEEFEAASHTSAELLAFQEKLAGLTFLDPACGSGNFLLVTYQHLRNLELDLIKRLYPSASDLPPAAEAIRVRPEQFYGIEIEDFPAEIAKVSMILMKHLCDMQFEEHYGRRVMDFPIRENANILHANALRFDWSELVPAEELDYIMGNPPFIGKKEQTGVQKNELLGVFPPNASIGNLDYVTGWYAQAIKLMAKNREIRAAFVSTNSISQGEQAPLFQEYILGQDVQIIFAYRTFKWSNAARGQAAVHCVIIGFTKNENNLIKTLFDGPNSQVVDNINAYLIDGPSITITRRGSAIDGILPMSYGSLPIDDGHLILTPIERDALLSEETDLASFIKQYLGGKELINSEIRYCLWLVKAEPGKFPKSKLLFDRLRACRNFRLASNRKQTKALADVPYLFGEIRQPDTKMLVIPKVSSENRSYIPIAFIEPEIIVSGTALMIPGADRYYFGLLASAAHNSWMRTVAGRMEMRYQYSIDIVYNNFPWPNPTLEQRAKIEASAQAILDARSLYPQATLADLYDELTMPIELRKAHQANDRAVWEAYGRAWDPSSEPACVAHLMSLYQSLTF